MRSPWRLATPWMRLIFSPGKNLAIEKQAESHDHPRVDRLDLAVEVGQAGGQLIRERIAVVRRPVLDHVGDEHLLAAQPDRAQQVVEELPGGADEGAPLLVLVPAGGLSDQHHLGVRVALAGDAFQGPLVEGAAAAPPHLSGDVFEGLLLRRGRGRAVLNHRHLAALCAYARAATGSGSSS